MTYSNQEKIVTDIVLTDVIGFSKLDSLQQLEIISFISLVYKKTIDKILKTSHMPLDKLIYGFVSTGDGFYCILHPRLKGYGVILGMNFHHLSDLILKKFDYFQGMQVAVHTGELYTFTDILGHKNFIGNGLNDCARYLELKNYSISTVIVSDEAYKSFKKFLFIFEDYNPLLIAKGFKYSEVHTFYDKHGNEKKGILVWLRTPDIIAPPDMNSNSMLS